MSEDNNTSANISIIPHWLFYSLVFVYGFYLVNRALRYFFHINLSRIIRSIGEAGEMTWFLIYELRTGLTLLVFYYLYRGLKRE